MPTGFDARPMATFSGLRGVPLLATSHNALFPSLRILAHGVSLRVIRRHDFTYDEIAEIDAAWRLGWQITFNPRSGPRNFTAAFAGRANAAQAVAMLHRHKAPLAPSALALLTPGA